MIDYLDIIRHYYDEKRDAGLLHILLTHSRSVADMAVEVCRAHPDLHADEDFVYAAAMLHDIGIIRCDAPGIQCFGTEPYICHGRLGAEMLREYAAATGNEGLEPYARVCERHTGTGLTAKTIAARQLPLPMMDFTPETTEEKIICYADKFFSKTHLDRKKEYEQVLRSLEKFGKEGVEVFKQWHEDMR